MRILPAQATTGSGDIAEHWPMRASPLLAATKELDVLRNRPDDLNQLLSPVALLAGEFQEFLSAGNNGAPFSRARDGDPTTAAELEQPLVTQEAKSTEDSVPVHGKHRCEVARRGRRSPGSALPSAIAS